MQTRTKGILFASIAALMWGVLAIALKVALNYLPAETLAWFRFAVAFIILGLYHIIFQRKSFKILVKPPLLALVAAVFLGLNYFGFIYGLSFTSPGNAQIFIQTGPLLLAIIGIFIFKEKIGIRKISGFIVVSLGFGLFYSEQIRTAIGSLPDYNMGVTWIIIGGISWAIFASLQKILVKNYKAGQLNLIIFGANAILFLPLVDFSPFVMLSPGQWILIISLGLNTLIAYGSLTLALKFIDANKISIIVTLNPIITFGALILMEYLAITWIQPEEFSTLALLGAFVVITGAVLVIYSRRTNN